MDTHLSLQTTANEAISFLRDGFQRLAVLQEQASTGSRINRPSDAPLDVATVMSGQAQDKRFDVYLSNVADARSFLNQSVSVLTAGAAVLNDATQSAIEGANGINDVSTFETLAKQVDEQLSRMLDLANTQSEGRYLYGGTASGTAPFVVTSTNSQGQPQTVDYVGSADPAQALIGPGQTEITRSVGSRVFQSSGQDVFKALIGLRDDLRNTAGLSAPQQAQAISQRLDDIQKARTGMLAMVGAQGDSLQNLDAVQTRVQDLQLQTRQLVQDRGGADVTEVLLQFQAQQSAFQVTLATTARLFDQNLLDFLR